MPDRRTVDELIADSDTLARETLLDVSADGGPAMVRTWYEVVQAAARLWTVLPTNPESGQAELDIMERLHALGSGIGRHTSTGGQPGPGRLDERLLEITENLTQASALIRRNVRSGQVDTPEAELDVSVIRGRVVHTLYVAAHGTSVALGEYASQVDQQIRTDEKRRHRVADRPDSAHGKAARELVARLAVFEQVAGDWVASHPAGVGADVSRGVAVPVTRLESALAGWDVQAHRTLAWNPDVPDLVRVARVQALLVAATGVVTQAAAHHGIVDQRAVQRLTPALHQAEAAWTHTARRWGELASPSSRTDPALISAAGEARAAIAAIAHTQTGWAKPDQIAQRMDFTRALKALHLGTASAVDLAFATRDVATTRQLAVPARAVAMRAQSEAEFAQDRGDLFDARKLWVTPSQLGTNQLIPLPEPVRRGLVNLSETVMAAAGQVAASTAPLLPGISKDHRPNMRDAGRPLKIPKVGSSTPNLDGLPR